MTLQFATIFANQNSRLQTFIKSRSTSNEIKRKGRPFIPKTATPIAPSLIFFQTPPDELNMTLVKALQSLCLLLSYDVNPTNSSDEGDHWEMYCLYELFIVLESLFFSVGIYRKFLRF